jgi:hypothetical protein
MTDVGDTVFVTARSACVPGQVILTDALAELLAEFESCTEPLTEAVFVTVALCVQLERFAAVNVRTMSAVSFAANVGMAHWTVPVDGIAQVTPDFVDENAEYVRSVGNVSVTVTDVAAVVVELFFADKV